ncbi:MAG: DUF106 domain-containing protein [Candidatus Thorarchaeota archaeon]|nr:DUF106 domain-containing protein [Candidatus Thorarchaeota archaeon]
MQDIIADIVNYFAGLLTPVSIMPNSAIFIVIVSISLAVISIVATRVFTNFDEMKEDMEKVKAWQAKFQEARKTQDPRLLQEVVDSQSQIMQIQGRMMSSRCKPMLIYYVPFMFIFAVLYAVYGNTVVAILPFNPQDALPFLEGYMGYNVEGAGFGMTFFWWYLLSSFGLGNLIRKAAGLQMM